MSPAGAKVLAVAQGGQPGLHPDYVQHKARVCGKARDLGKDGGCKGQLAVVIKDLRNTRTLVEDQVESDTPPPRRYGMAAKLDKLLTAGLDPIKLLSSPFWAPLQPKQPAKQPAQQPAKRSNPQDAKPAAKRQARQPAAAADDAGVGASAAPAAAAPRAAAAAAPRKRQRKRQRRAPSPAAAGGRGASKELTVKEAIEAVLGQLEVRIGGTLVGMVRQAQLQLVLPATGSLRPPTGSTVV